MADWLGTAIAQFVLSLHRGLSGGGDPSFDETRLEDCVSANPDDLQGNDSELLRCRPSILDPDVDQPSVA